MPAGSLVVLGLNWLLVQAPAAGWPASAGAAPTLVRPAPADDMPRWLAQRRRLRINFGVSAGVLGAGAATLALGATLECRSDEPVLDCIPIAAIVGGVIAVAAAIPTLVYAVRLTAHNERRPRNTRVQLGPGGLLLRF